MRRCHAPNSSAEPVLSWAQRAEPYGGPFRAQYRRAVELLAEGQPMYESSNRSARRFRAVAKTLVVLATLLAAAATITIIPTSIDRFVAAVLAFLAAVTSGLTATLESRAGIDAGRKDCAAVVGIAR